MTVNGVMARILGYFTEFRRFRADYVEVVYAYTVCNKNIAQIIVSSDI